MKRGRGRPKKLDSEKRIKVSVSLSRETHEWLSNRKMCVSRTIDALVRLQKIRSKK